jgi:hypothetical protein
MGLSDFVAELKKRGFDGFDDADLIRYINFGYRTVGRLTKWSWEEGTFTVSLDPGEYRFELETELPTLKSVKAVVITNTAYEARLAALTEDDYYTRYAAYDLTSSKIREEPDSYYLSGTHLYILPPPIAIRNFTITGEQILAELVSGSNETPITPEEYDEAILLAAEEQCHIRARQPQFAAVNRQKLVEFFDDAMADDHSRSEDRQERVTAGRTHL